MYCLKLQFLKKMVKQVDKSLTISQHAKCKHHIENNDFVKFCNVISNTGFMLKTRILITL